MTIVAVDYNDDDATKAQAQVQAMLQKNPDLGGIFGTNVFSAQGAGTVVANLGLSGKVKVVAFDATKDAINMLKRRHRRPGDSPETRRYGLLRSRNGHGIHERSNQHPQAHPHRLCRHHA